MSAEFPPPTSPSSWRYGTLNLYYAPKGQLLDPTVVEAAYKNLGLCAFGQRETPRLTEEAIKRHGIRAKWTARSLALHMQAVLQGVFILAKAKGDAAIARDSVDHLLRYAELLFRTSTRKDQHHDHE
jgi:hypothetical protein